MSSCSASATLGQAPVFVGARLPRDGRRSAAFFGRTALPALAERAAFLAVAALAGDGFLTDGGAFFLTAGFLAGRLVFLALFFSLDF